MFGKTKEAPSTSEQPNPYFDGVDPSRDHAGLEKWLRKDRLRLIDDDLTPIPDFKSGFREKMKHDILEICQWEGQDDLGQPRTVNAFLSSNRYAGWNSVVIQMPQERNSVVSDLKVAIFDIGPHLEDHSYDRSTGAVHIDEGFEIAGFFLMAVKAARMGIGFLEVSRAFKEATGEVRPEGSKLSLMDYQEIGMLKRAFSENLAKAAFIQ